MVQAFVDGVPVTGGVIAGCLRRMVPLSSSMAGQFASMQAWAEANARSSG